MTQKTWSTVEISAYLDGALDNRSRAAFEAALGRDETLRQEVDALRATVDFVRSVPMRESPRNYLLTPAMVKQSRQVSTRQRRPIVTWMRLATSLSAIAFVIMFGLNFLTNTSSKMALQPVNDASTEMKSTAAGVLVAEADEAVIAEDVVLQEAAPQPLQRTGIEETSEGHALGDGPVGAAASMAPTDTMQNSQMVEPESFKNAENGAPAEGELAISHTMSLTYEASPPMSALVAQEPSATPEIVVGADRQTFPSQWVTAILGVVTLVLAVVTFKMSRRP